MENNIFYAVSSGQVSVYSGQYRPDTEKSSDKRNYEVFTKDTYPTRKMTIKKVKYV